MCAITYIVLYVNVYILIFVYLLVLSNKVLIHARIWIPLNCLYLFFLALRPNAGDGILIHVVSRTHTTMRHSRQDFSGGVISSSQRPTSDNTQYLQGRDNHALGGIRTHILNRQAAADLRLRLHGHWDRLI
jgi:hypothetical protein